MIDQVNADGIMLAQSHGYLQLGADAVHTGNENRLLIPFKLKKPAEEADAAQNLGAVGSLCLFPNQRLGFRRDVNADTSGGIGVSDCFTVHRRYLIP